MTTQIVSPQGTAPASPTAAATVFTAVSKMLLHGFIVSNNTATARTVLVSRVRGASTVRIAPTLPVPANDVLEYAPAIKFFLLTGDSLTIQGSASSSLDWIFNLESVT